MAKSKLRNAVNEIGVRIRAAWESARPPTEARITRDIREIADVLALYVQSIGVPRGWSEKKARAVAMSESRRAYGTNLQPDLEQIARAGMRAKRRKP